MFPLVMGLIGVPIRDAIVTAASVAYFVPGLHPQVLDLAGQGVTVEHPTYQSTDGSGLTAALYRPAAAGRHSAIIVVHGWNDLAENAPQAIQFGLAMAHSGHIVLIPHMEMLARGIVDQSAIDDLVASTRYLAARPDVDPGRIGLFGVCLGGTVALSAAADSRMPHLAAILALNATYDVSDLIQGATTGTATTQGKVVPWVADQAVKGVLDINLAQLEADLPAAVADLERLHTNTDPTQVAGLMAKLPKAALDRLDVASPGPRLADVHAHVVLLQAHGDPVVPPGTLERFRSALRHSDATVAGTENALFRHNDLAPPPFSLESFKAVYWPGFTELFGASYDFLSHVDGWNP